MERDAVLRATLWLTAPANVLVAGATLAPDSALGAALGLPLPAPAPIYRALLALFLALFGAAYAWLARADVIDRPFVVFAAIGKATAFGATFALWCAGAASGRFVSLIAGDLLCATIFAWWAWNDSRATP